VRWACQGARLAGAARASERHACAAGHLALLQPGVLALVHALGEGVLQEWPAHGRVCGGHAAVLSGTTRVHAPAARPAQSASQRYEARRAQPATPSTLRRAVTEVSGSPIQQPGRVADSGPHPGECAPRYGRQSGEGQLRCAPPTGRARSTATDRYLHGSRNRLEKRASDTLCRSGVRSAASVASSLCSQSRTGDFLRNPL